MPEDDQAPDTPTPVQASPSPAVQAEPKKKVWMACRATQDCPGNWAEIVFQRSTGFSDALRANIGSKIIRYRCLTCKKVWHINF